MSNVLSEEKKNQVIALGRLGWLRIPGHGDRDSGMMAIAIPG